MYVGPPESSTFIDLSQLVIFYSISEWYVDINKMTRVLGASFKGRLSLSLRKEGRTIREKGLSEGKTKERRTLTEGRTTGVKDKGKKDKQGSTQGKEYKYLHVIIELLR